MPPDLDRSCRWAVAAPSEHGEDDPLIRYSHRSVGLTTVIVVGALSLAGRVRAEECARLTQLLLPDMKVVAAVSQKAGPFTPSGSGGKAVSVPAFCRAQLEATPTSDSRIGFEVWLPKPGHGTASCSGSAMAGIRVCSTIRRWPTASPGATRWWRTDQGHQGEDLRFVVGHPAKIEDWADRAIHVDDGGRKLVVRDAMGQWPARSYFAGCSTGGFQGMAETQRHPNDYDGVVAGAPGYPRIDLSASFLAAWIANHDANGAEILPRSKLALINRSAVAACDALDGVKDGVIDDPRACHFDPAALLCQGDDAEDCLTQAQVDVVRRDLRRSAQPAHAASRSSLAGTLEARRRAVTRGSAGRAYIVGQPEPVRLELWKYWLFGDPNFDWHTFDFDRDLAAASRRLPSMNAAARTSRRSAPTGASC